MDPAPDPIDSPQQALFREAMLGSETDKIRMRRFFRMLPAGPRCKACNAPFGVPGSLISRATGRQRWDKNPRFCNRCTRSSWTTG